MKRFKSVLFIFLAAILVVLPLAGCGGTGGSKSASSKPAAKNTTKNTTTVALPDEPSTLDAQQADDGNMRDVTNSVVQSLISLNSQTLNPEPCLAVSWSKPSPTVWDFKLRQGVKFSNGDPFNADDVVYSVNRQVSSALKSEIVGDFSTFKSIKKINDYEVQLTTTGPDNNVPQRISLLKILDEKWMKANPDAVNTTTVIGTGPYKVVKWARGNYITLTRNPYYWGTKAPIENVKVRFIQEDATRAAAVKTGEVDLAVNMLPEYVSELPDVVKCEGINSGMVRFNVMAGVFKDPRLRLAAIYAVDNQAIAKSLYEGYATLANPMLQKKGYIGYDGNLQPYPYNLAKAKELLKEAGYHGQQVQLIGETGRWLKDGELVQTVGQMLTQAGFNVQVKTLAFSQWLKILFDRQKAPDMIFVFHSVDTYDVDRTLSTYVLSTGPGSSYPSTLDNAIVQARTIADPAKQQAAYENIEAQLYKSPAWISLITIDDIYGMQKDITYTPRRDSCLDLAAISFK